MSRGRFSKRRPVRTARTRGTRENNRRLTHDEQDIWARREHDSPNGLSPGWLLVAIPHEAPDKGPNGGDKQCRGDKHRGSYHDGFDKNPEKEYVDIADDGTQKRQDCEQWHSVQQSEVGGLASI